MQKDIIIVENFYSDPYKVREYALKELKSNSYLPYGNDSWKTTAFKKWNDCPFKSSKSLTDRLSDIINEEIDLDAWRLGLPWPGFPSGAQPSMIKEKMLSFLKEEAPPFFPPTWNCAFHTKPVTGQKLGEGVHNHVIDIWNSVGENGWVGLIYLNPDAPVDSGLFLWENLDPKKNYDWMSESDQWKLIDSCGAVFNRLILCRGKKPHSGADGFSNLDDAGRLYQTFFFTTKKTSRKTFPSVEI